MTTGFMATSLQEICASKETWFALARDGTSLSRSDFLPDEDGSAFLCVEVALVGSRRDREHVAVQRVKSDLIGSGPGLLPGDVDVVRDLLGFERERPGVGHHSPQQLDAFLFGRNSVSGRGGVVAGEDRVHPVSGRVSDVAVRIFAELVEALAGCEHFANVGLQPPGPENGADIRVGFWGRSGISGRGRRGRTVSGLLR